MDLFVLLPISNFNALHRPTARIGGHMKKRIAAASLALGLLVFAPTSIACLGDLCLRDPGPCYGYGCPGFKAGATTTSQKVTKHHKSK